MIQPLLYFFSAPSSNREREENHRPTVKLYKNMHKVLKELSVAAWIFLGIKLQWYQDSKSHCKSEKKR